MERLLLDTFFALCRLIPAAGACLAVIGILNFLFMIVSALMNAGPDRSLTGFRIMKKAETIIRIIFRLCSRLFIVVLILGLMFYLTIFCWSIKIRDAAPSREEYFQALSDRLEYFWRPISKPTNLIGVSEDDVERIFGEADSDHWYYKRYFGQTDIETRYQIIVIYLPVADCVLWYEGLLGVG